MARYLSQFPISSGFRTSARPDHNGVDIAAPHGTPLPSLTDGVVQFEGFIPAAISGYSKELICIIQSGDYFIVYGHLLSTVVSAGQKVSKGQIIGHVGNSGYVIPKPSPANPKAGAHLHIEMRVGKKVNSAPLSAYNPKDITPLINVYGTAQGGGEEMTKEQSFQECFITQAGRWANASEVAAWQKSGLAAYTWVQKNAPNPAKEALTNYQKQAEAELSALSEKEIQARVALENAERAFKDERALWNDEKDRLVNSHNRELVDLQAHVKDLEQENENCNIHLKTAQREAKDVSRWTWQDHFQAFIQKLFAKGGD